MAEGMKACPFCGGRAQIASYGLSQFVPGCDACDLHLAPQETEADAAKVWNSRLLCLGQKAARFAVPALLNEANRLQHLSEVAVDDDAKSDYDNDASYLRAVARGISADLEKLSQSRQG